jgi:hypothetical protein
MGSVYGPNGNNVNFYNVLRCDLERLGQAFIIGGDFNTIICNEGGLGNVDRKGEGRVTNPHNSRVINQWIEEGFAVDPYRLMYPLQQEVSHIPFRSIRNEQGEPRYVHNRLDFYLITPNVANNIEKVKYEDRLGADFDHKEVVMYLGKRIKGCKTMIFDSTLKDILSESVGTLSIYEVANAHLVIPDQMLTNSVSQLDILIREKELINHVLRIRGDSIVLTERLNTVDRNIETVTNRLLTTADLMERDFTCDFCKLYEVTVMNLKNRLVALQKKRILERNEERDGILNRIQYMEHKFGANSVQTNDEKEKLLRFDDAKLKEKAIMFRDFLDSNNEKATKVFCKLSKEGGLCDDQEVIRDSNGEGFGDSKQRTEYIRRYYEGVYKKRLDNLLSIEEFFGGGVRSTSEDIMRGCIRKGLITCLVLKNFLGGGSGSGLG